MESLTLQRENHVPWRRSAVCLLTLSVVWNVAQAARINYLEVARMDAAAQLLQAEQARGSCNGHIECPCTIKTCIGARCPDCRFYDRAVGELEKMTIRAEQEQQPVAANMATFAAADAYVYIGECTVTSYCPCSICCGQWADGLTATGIPAVPGIVAVDPEVIPLGSVVVIGGQRYLAADTGVKGLHVDVCAGSHQDAKNFGVQTLAVWLETEEETHG